MVEGTGKRAKSTDRHIITLSPELSEQVDDALEVARLSTILKPVEATLGNPVAIPILAGGVGVLAAVLFLKWKFPDPLAQARDEVEKAAKGLAEFFQEIIPFQPPVEGEGPNTLDVLIQNLTDLFMRFWNDPLFGFGGSGGRGGVRIA